MKRAATAMLVVGWFVAVGLAPLWADADGATALEPLVRLLTGTGAAAAWVAACSGAGGAILNRLSPDALRDDVGELSAFVIGLAAWGLVGLAVAAAGALGPLGISAIWLLLASGWLARPRPELPALGAGAVVAGLFLLAPGLVAGLTPPVDTDELYYHLALPRQMLQEGGLLGGVLHPDGSRPMALHLAYACLLATGGEAAVKLFHLGIAGAVLAGTLTLGRRHVGGHAGEVAALLLAGSWTFLSGTGIAGNDIPAALCVLASLHAALSGRASVLALAAGAALAIKYTAGGAVAGVFLVAALPLRRRVLASGGALAIVGVWWLRNIVEGVHPLFPFAGWAGPTDFPFQYLDKYGAGRDLVSLLLLPWNAVMTASPLSFRFLGRVSPAMLALAPFALWATVKALRNRPGSPSAIPRLFVAAAAGAVFWAAGPHWLRYLLPAMPLVALWLGSAVVVHRSVAAAAVACVCLGAPGNLAPIARDVGDRVAVVTGTESREAWLTRSLGDYAAIAWANAHLPADARVALLFDWSGYHLDRAYVLGSVEDHVPTRHWLVTHGEASLADLRKAGVTHVVVTRTRFISKSYPFLDEKSFDRWFTEPSETLDELLLMQATLQYKAGRTSVYRLDAPAP